MLTRSEILQSILDKAVENGLSALVLTTEEGLPLSASTGDDYAKAEILAAIAPIFQHTAEQSGRSLLRSAEEMVMRSSSGNLIVCRFLVIGEENFILAGTVPKRRPYRRVMNCVIKEIRSTWEEVLYGR